MTDSFEEHRKRMHRHHRRVLRGIFTAWGITIAALVGIGYVVATTSLEDVARELGGFVKVFREASQ